MSNTIFNNITLTKKIKLKNKIIMYCGNDLPDGYLWCDGSYGTPNLKDRFIYGISGGSPGNFGDSEINYIPPHNHSIESFNAQNSTNRTINNINYKSANNTDTFGVNGTRKGSGDPATHKQHHHEISNVQSELITDVVEINFNSSNNQPNTIYDSIENTTTPNSNIFNQKYIYIGFIMKI